MDPKIIFKRETVDDKIIMKKYVEFSTGYYISEDLKIFSTISNRYIKVNPKNLNVVYLKDKKRQSEKIHYIAARVFLEKEEGKKYVIFKDGNSKNRDISNISWSEKRIPATTYNKIKYTKIMEEVVINGIPTIKEVELRSTHKNGYYASEYSNIYSLKKVALRKLKIYKRSSGIEYIRVPEYIDTNYLTIKAFYPEQPEKKYVLYKDGNINNKHYTNLIWSDIPELEDEHLKFKTLEGFSNYKFSKDGVCKSYFAKEPKIISPAKDGDGYYKFVITADNGKKYSLRRARVIAKIYINNPHGLPIVDHINNKRWDDRAENLRWVNHKENSENRDYNWNQGKTVLQFDLNGTLLNKFKTLVQASKFLLENENIHLTPKKLSRYILKNRDIINIEDNFTLHGYIWRYLYYDEKYILQEDEVAVKLCGNFEGKNNINFPTYKITNYGNIINKKGYKLSHVFINGCKAVHFAKKGKTVSYKIHILVALFFVQGRTKEKYFVNHIDENRLNCYYGNLEWVTPSENSLHSSYKRMKPVDQFDSKTGEFIRRFPSVKSAEEYMGSASDSIGNICRMKGNTLYGYIWRFANYGEIPDKITINVKNTSIPVEQYDLKGNYITTHDSVLIAGKIIKGNEGAIRQCCLGRSKTSGGFIWKYKEYGSICNSM